MLHGSWLMAKGCRGPGARPQAHFFANHLCSPDHHCMAISHMFVNSAEKCSGGITLHALWDALEPSTNDSEHIRFACGIFQSIHGFSINQLYYFCRLIALIG